MAPFPQQIKAYLVARGRFQVAGHGARRGRLLPAGRGPARPLRTSTAENSWTTCIRWPASASGGQRGIGPGRDRSERVDHPLGPHDLQAPAAQQQRGAAGGGGHRGHQPRDHAGEQPGLAAPMAAGCCCGGLPRPGNRCPPNAIDEQHEANQPGDDELRFRHGHFPAGLYRRQEDRQAALELARGNLALPGT